MRRKRLLIPTTLVVVAMTVAACGSDSKKGGNAGSAARTTVAPPPQSKEPQEGVTDDSIKVGVALIDFKPIQSFIDFNHGDAEEVSRVMIDALNKEGGIAGRKLDAVYKTYTPIGTQFPTEVCTKFTEDDKVFATLGNIIDPSGASQTCVTKQHGKVMFGYDLTDTMTNAAPGLMLTPGITFDRRLNVLLSVLKEQGTLKGKKVAVLAEPSTKNLIESTIEPTLKEMGVEQGTSGVADTGATTDTSAAERQLDSFIERWKTEGVNAVIVSGQNVVAKQFVPKLVSGLPGVLILTDAQASGLGAAQDMVASKVDPNPYEGMLTASGLSDQQAFETPEMQECVKTYKDNGGEQEVVAPEDLKPNADGKRVQVYVAVSNICSQLHLMKTIGDKVGTYLNNDNWIRTVSTLGKVEGLPGSEFASISNGKYDADDTFGLAAFSSSANDYVLEGDVSDANADAATSTTTTG